MKSTKIIKNEDLIKSLSPERQAKINKEVEKNINSLMSFFLTFAYNLSKFKI